MPVIEPKSANFFSNQLRAARLVASADAEAFDGIIHVVERLGSYLSRERLQAPGGTDSDGCKKRNNRIRAGSLAQYKKELAELAEKSVASNHRKSPYRKYGASFDSLYDLVIHGRNDALHQGAYARHLTKHTIELAIILEDALSSELHSSVSEFMVGNPVCAEPWHFVAFVRQQMLANSYSHLPVRVGEGWKIASDAAIATFLGPDRTGDDRKKRLTSTLEEAEAMSKPLRLIAADFIDQAAPVGDALGRFSQGIPILLVQDGNSCKRAHSGPDAVSHQAGIVGVLTPFDVL